MLRFRAAVPFLLALAVNAHATDVSGTITTQTWTKANSPYQVTGDITIPAGNTLTIEPGVTVNLPWTGIVVDGVLDAQGSAQDGIRFLGASSGWNDISFREGSRGQFSYASITGGYTASTGGRRGGVTIYDADVSFDHCFLTYLFNTHPIGWDVSVGAVYVRGNATLTMRDCLMSECSSGAGGGGFLYADSHATVTLVRCRVTTNSTWNAFGGGIRLVHASAAMDSCEISYNRIKSIDRRPSDYPGGGIVAQDSTQLVMRSCVVRSNSAISGGGGIAVYGGTT